MIRLLTILMITAITLPLSAKSKGANLILDYSGKKLWKYTMEYQSTCIFTGDTSLTEKKTHIKGELAGAVSKKNDSICFSMGNLAIESEMYGEETRAEILKQLTAINFCLEMTAGYPALDSVMDLSSEGLPEWNFYMQFAKLLPDMPAQAVSKGYSWERTVTLPVKSPGGNVQCEVYRLYEIERLSPALDTAYIKWQFKYSPAGKTAELSNIMKFIPVYGKGTGTAVIDIGKRCIVSADMQFETPVADVSIVKVNWKEQASLRILK